MAEPTARAGVVLAVVYYAVAVALAYTVVLSANTVSRTYTELSREHSAEAKADRLVDDVLGAITFGLYRGDRERNGRIEQAMRTAARHERRAVVCGWSLLAASVGFVLAIAVIARRTGRWPTSLARHLLGVSAVFLAVGLLAPILTVEARGEVAVLGEVVLHHESRGILTTVEKLWRTGNGVVAALLLLFSVVVPIGKLVLTIAALAPLPDRARGVATRAIVVVGRWSMTDVFVVAVLLAFLASEGKALTDARLGPGLYFFAGYGLLSLAAGQLLAHRGADWPAARAGP